MLFKLEKKKKKKRFIQENFRLKLNDSNSKEIHLNVPPAGEKNT